MPTTFSKQVKSEVAKKTEDYIESVYKYQTTRVEKTPNGISVRPVTHKMVFKTKSSTPRLGVMLVGWGGNNGSTVTATILANKLNMSWKTKHGAKVINAVKVLVMKLCRSQDTIVCCVYLLGGNKRERSLR